MFENIYALIEEQFRTNEFFSGAFLVTTLVSALGGIFLSLKVIPVRIWNRIKRRFTYTLTIYEHNDLFFALEYYFAKHHPTKYRNVEAGVGEQFKQGDLMVGDEKANTSSHEEEEIKKPDLEYRHHSDDFALWYKGFPMYVWKEREKLNNIQSPRHAFLVKFIVSGVFAKRKITQLVEEAYDEYFKMIQSRRRERVTKVLLNDSYGSWEVFNETSKQLDQLVLDKVFKKDLLERLDEFKKSKERYYRTGIPYKFTIMLEGPPGNGKTSLAAGIASYLKKNVCYLNLKSLSGDDALQAAFKEIPNNAVLVLEDIDALFDENRNPLGNITMSALLNCLDGVFYKEGLISIATTNFYDKLDEALVRPGRIHERYTIGNPGKEVVEQYLEVYYEQPVKLDKYHPDRSMAKVVKVCLQNSKEKAKEILETRL